MLKNSLTELNKQNITNHEVVVVTGLMMAECLKDGRLRQFLNDTYEQAGNESEITEMKQLFSKATQLLDHGSLKEEIRKIGKKRIKEIINAGVADFDLAKLLDEKGKTRH